MTEGLREALEQLIHIPAALEGEFGISRSQARMEIDLGRVKLNGRTLAPGEHDIPLSACLSRDGVAHLERRVDKPFLNLHSR
jgi:RNA-binding protein YlmH